MQARLRLCILMLLFSVKSISQDANYWTNQYSSGGFFLPGAVVANNNDSGVLFINPALLAHSKITTISANATIYHADKINIQNGAGKGYNLTSKALGSTPAVIAGNFTIPKAKNLTIAYGLIQSASFSYAASQRRDGKFNVLNDSYSPGPETFVGQYLDENSSSDFKMIAAAGWSMFKHLSIGLSVEGQRHHQTINQDYYARTLVNAGSVAPFTLVDINASYYIDYAVLGLTPKLGLAWDNNTSHSGIVLTLPLISLGGNATLLSDNTINNIDFTETGNHPLTFFANTRQENLNTRLKAPLSIAAGFTQDVGKWQLYIAAEYFCRIKEYNIVTPDNTVFIRPDTISQNIYTADLLKLKDARKKVLNIAAGVKYNLNEKYNLYFSLRTDNTYYNAASYTDSTDGVIPNASMWNIYHVQAGVNIKKQKFNMRGGIYGSLGSTNHYRPSINFNNPSESNLLIGVPETTKATYFSIGFMLSYVHNF